MFNLSKKIGQEFLEELLKLIDDKLKKERKEEKFPIKAKD